MGKGEGRIKKHNLKKTILNAVYTAGVLSVALLSPTTAGAILKLTGKNKNYRARRAVSRLIEDGLLKKEDDFLRLTSLGEQKAKMLYAGEITIKKPNRWDGKWRIVIYDLKEAKKHLRDKLRMTLNSIGFMKLQNSVWVYPYDCEDLIALIKADFKIGKEVLYMIVEHLENDRGIKKIFNLPA